VRRNVVCVVVVVVVVFMSGFYICVVRRIGDL